MSSSHILIKLIDHTQGQMWFIFGNIWLGEFLFCYCRPLIFYNIKVHFLKGWLVKWPTVLGVFFGQTQTSTQFSRNMNHFKIIDYFCEVIYFKAVLFLLFADALMLLWTIDTVDTICCAIKESNFSIFFFFYRRQ